MTGLYELMLDRLRTMDEKQLLELFHDIGELEVVERIADCAYHFVENYCGFSDCDSVKTYNHKINKELKEADDARRHREHEESERRNY